VSDDPAPEPRVYTFDEFKLYYESTEKVTDRRLAANTSNYGLCSAIIIAIASLNAWALPKPEFRIGSVAATLILARMGWQLCVLWDAQIRDFKALNAAKFEVLNKMAPSVRFGPSDTRVSAEPFDREWQILKSKEAAHEIRAMGMIALQSSEAELSVPVAFLRPFQLIIAAAIAATFWSWRPMTASLTDAPMPRAAQMALAALPSASVPRP
jgi:hypothetical protein